MAKEYTFAELIHEYLQPVYNFIVRLVHDTDEASDLAQETWIKVWKHFDDLDTEKNIKAWIFTIARRTVIDWTRKRKVSVFSTLDKEDSSFEESIQDTELLPAEIFEQKEFESIIEHAFQQISPDAAMLVYLHNMEHLTFEEIAEVVDRPMNTVKSLYRRALLNLKKYIEKR